MRDYAKVLPQFWIGFTGRQIKALGKEVRLLALYLLTSPHASMIGIYYLPISLITHETDIPFEAASKGLRSLSEIGFCSYDEAMEYVWIHEMANYQIGGQLKQTDNRIKSINDIYQKLPNLSFLPKFFEKYKDQYGLENAHEKGTPFEGASKPLRSQEQEQEQEQEQKRKTLMSGKPDAFPLKDTLIFEKQNAENKKTTTYKTQALEILDFLNAKTGRAYRPVETNLKLIVARLKTGATVMNCRQVIVKKSREWKGDPKMNEYLRPATLFNATKFEQYVGELVVSEDEA